MALEIKLCKEDMQKIDACVDLILLEKYRDAAALMEGCSDPLMIKLQELCTSLCVSEAYLKRLSQGDIFATNWPSTHPGSRMLKQFHLNLHRLLYQMKRFAQGEYYELVEDMGDMSRCYNGMLKHLHRKQVQADLSSRQDSLTGLFNRRAFLEQADMRIKDNPGQEGVMLVVGLERLCDITDEFGRDGCDQFITSAAHGIRDAAEWKDLVGRVSENEFSLYIHGPKNTKETLIDLEALVLDFGGRSVEIKGKRTPFCITCGAARYPTDHTAAHRLLEQALYAVRTWEYLNQRQRNTTSTASGEIDGEAMLPSLDNRTLPS